MKPPLEELNRIIDASYDDDDLAEEFQWFAEDHVELDDDDAFVASVQALPPVMRRLYLAIHADAVISGDGFPSYYEPSRPAAFYEDAAEGFRLIGKTRLAETFIYGITYLSSNSISRIVEMDEATSKVHGRFFEDHKDVPARIGAFIASIGRKY